MTGDVDPTPIDAPNFATQLSNVFVHELSARRRETEEGDPSGPTVTASSPAAVLSEDRTGFSIQWAVRVFVPAVPGQAVEIDCTIEGHFTSEGGPVDDDLFSSFKSRESFILLWPYARAAVGEITRMMALDVPPLPIVDVHQFLSDGHDVVPEGADEAGPPETAAE